MGAVDAGFFGPKGVTEVFRRGAGEGLRGGLASPWVTAIAILIAPSALAVAGQYLIWSAGAGQFMESMQKGAASPQSIDPSELFRALALMGIVGGLTGIVSFVAQYAAGAAVARMVAERVLGRPYTPAAAWDFVLGRAWPIIAGGFVMMVAITAAAIAGEIPGGIVGVVIGASSGGMKQGSPPLITRIAPVVTMLPALIAAATYLAPMAAVTAIENQGGVGSLTRSIRLVSGHFWHVLGVFALAALAFTLPAIAGGVLPQTPVAAHLRESMGAANGMLVLSGATSALSLLLSPFMLTTEAAIYFDLRSRLRDESFAAYELALDLGGELPEGVVAPEAEGASGSPSASEPFRGAAPTSDIS